MDMADPDPLIRALLEDLGLIPPEKDLKIIVDAPTAELRDVTKTVGDIPSEKNVKVNREYAQVGDGTDLTGATAYDIPIKTKLEPPDTTNVDGFTLETKTIPTKLEVRNTTA